MVTKILAFLALVACLVAATAIMGFGVGILEVTVLILVGVVGVGVILGNRRVLHFWRP